MKKMSIEVMEQLLKDLAANVGYELISNPFDTPFEEASIEELPESKFFFWTVPTSVLNSKEHESFRKNCVEADIIDTVCITSIPWPTDAEESVAMLLIDVTRRRRGSIKFVDATAWNFSDETDMAAVCNLLIHDLFPREDFLAFQMDQDAMDLYLDNNWYEQVCIYAACDVESLNPKDYIHKLGYDKEGMCLIADVFDIRYPIADKDITELKKSAILLSTIGKLCPQIIEPGKDTQNISVDGKMLLVPNDGYLVDFNYALQLFGKEEVLRQLPITRRITLNDMWRVVVESKGWYKDFSDEIFALYSKGKMTHDEYFALSREFGKMTDDELIALLTKKRNDE